MECDLQETEPNWDLGVNLEGMAYDDWPISRLIGAERFRPKLPEVIARLANPETIILCWWRDCWQATGRVGILEGAIEPTPITLDRVTPSVWQTLLCDAEQCLDPDRQYTGRRTMTVTLAGSRQRVERAVSPHLQFRTELWSETPLAVGDCVRRMQEARDRLAPLFDFVVDRTKPGRF